LSILGSECGLYALSPSWSLLAAQNINGLR
jgi:hypothetical protein